MMDGAMERRGGKGSCGGRRWVEKTMGGWKLLGWRVLLDGSKEPLEASYSSFKHGELRERSAKSGLELKPTCRER